MAYINQYGRQYLDASDIESVVQTLSSDFLTQGPAVEEFESLICSTVGAEYSVACANGTAALHLAMLALDIGSGNTVWTTPITFVASANAARYVGARVDLVDIDQATWNMCPLALEKKLSQAASEGKATPDLVVVVHFAGCPAPMDQFKKLADHWGFRLIEDASHALGSAALYETVGACTYSEAATFSFHPVKNITTGEGGAVTTNSPLLAKRLRKLRSHGIDRVPSEDSSAKEPWWYEQTELGFNYRLSDIQAALGKNQLGKLAKFIAKRSHLIEIYKQNLANIKEVTFQNTNGQLSAYHLAVIRVPEDKRLALYQHLKNNQIGAQIHYIPIYRHPYYSDLGDPANFPISEAYYQSTITLPLHNHLTDNEIITVCDHVKKIVAV